MCGIIGILSSHEVAPSLINALQRLEYRGYDSAGIATVHEGVLDRRREVGKLVNLSDLLVHQPLRGLVGIGHTRWATHGAPTQKNAHPHQAGKVAVVHNGIIENFRTLRQELAEAGIAHETDTDTEVIALLTQQHLAQGMTPEEAVASTLTRLEGAFALAFIFAGEENLMIGARRGSPLVVGYGQGEMYLGSDAIALAQLTNRVTYLEEGDWVVLNRTGAEYRDASNGRVNRPVTQISIAQAQVDKGGHKHFMAKEITEQPSVLKAGLAHHITRDGTTLSLSKEVDFTDCDRVIMVACGTGFYAAQVAKYWFEQLSGLPVEIDIASEFRYRKPVLGERNIAIFISQSGETADTLAALRHVHGKVAHTVGVINVPTSSIARETDVALPILAGPEISVASTKGFTAQLLVLLLLSLKAGQDCGVLTVEEVTDHLQVIHTLPGLMAQAINQQDKVKALAVRLAEFRDVLFLGRGMMYPLALEAALKMKELSYMHAEGYASGELKHGPIALIDKTMPIVVLAPRDSLYEKTVSNMQEVMARAGKVLLISDLLGLEEAGEIWASLPMPATPELIAPIIYAVPVQQLAYHTALARGTDIDQPRNLAKSVTVE